MLLLLLFVLLVLFLQPVFLVLLLELAPQPMADVFPWPQFELISEPMMLLQFLLYLQLVPLLLVLVLQVVLLPLGLASEPVLFQLLVLFLLPVHVPEIAPPRRAGQEVAAAGH